MNVLPDAIKPCLQGASPGTITTIGPDGRPNITFISQAWWVDGEHVAISQQFFNKTAKNVRRNPRAALFLIDPTNFAHWLLDAEFERSETEGSLYDEMAMQLEVVASMTGMSDVFHLLAADVFRIRSVQCIDPLAEG